MNISNTEELKFAINRLKEQRLQREMEINRDFKLLVQQAGDSITNMSISMGSGALAKKLIPFKSDSILSNLASYGLQGAVTAVAFKNAKKIKAVAFSIWKNIFKRS